MRALVFTGPGRAEVRTVDPPRAEKGQVVVDVERVGICGTDMELFSGEMSYFGTGGSSFPFTAWKPGVKIVVARLGVDLRGWQDVDVEVATADGRPVKTFRDVHCAPEDGALYAVCHEPLARLAFARGRTISRIIGTRGGARETVAVFDVQPAAV